MTRALSVLLTVVVFAMLAAGCQDPYARNQVPTGKAQASPPAASDVDRPGPRAATIAQSRAPRGLSATQTAKTFATRWVNWDWQSVAPQQRRLAALATGPLARDLRASARSARVDASLARDKPGSRGTVEAVDLTLEGARRSGIVVTQERSYTGQRADLGGRRYRVYRIQLSQDSAGWGVSRWEPQP